jgi:hypothetical protein
VREHPRDLVIAVLAPLFAVVVDIGPERRRDHAVGLNPADEIRVDERAVLDAMAAVGVGPFLQRPLVRLEHHVDRHVAVGVHADLEPVAVGIVDRFVELLLRQRQDAVILRADIRRAHPHRAL